MVVIPSPSVALKDYAYRETRYKMLTKSGCVVQNADGTLEVMSAEKAAERVAAMDEETRAFYE